MKRQLKAAGVLLGLGSLILGGSPAAAQDAKAYLGAMCAPVGNGSPTLTTLGIAHNFTTKEAIFICPAVRDATGAESDVTDWDVTVQRLGDNRDWDVFLRSASPTSVSFFQSVISVPSGNAIQRLDGGSIASSFAFGPLYILSPVPPSGGIYNYQVTEN